MALDQSDKDQFYKESTLSNQISSQILISLNNTEKLNTDENKIFNIAKDEHSPTINKFYDHNYSSDTPANLQKHNLDMKIKVNKTSRKGDINENSPIPVYKNDIETNK